MVALLAGLASLATPFVIICTIVLFISWMSGGGKKTNNAAKPSGDGAVKPESPAIGSPKPKNPNTGLNVLLISGASLVVFALMSFVNEVDGALVPPTVIGLTLISFGIGAYLYKSKEFLKPLAVTLILLSLASFPFLYYAYTNMSLSDHVSGVLSTLSTFIAMAVACVLMKSRALAYLAYIWLGAVFYALVPHEWKPSAKDYVYLLVPILMSFPPMIAFSSRAKWLPVYMRHAARTISYVVIPFVGLAFLENIESGLGSRPDSPFLASAIVILSFVYYFLWAKYSKNRVFTYIWRGLLQLSVLMLTYDILRMLVIPDRYTYGINANMKPGDGVISEAVSRLILYIVETVSFMAQAVVTFISNRKDKISKVGERIFGIISMVGIIFASISFASSSAVFSSQLPLSVYITGVILSSAICGVLGIAFAKHFKAVYWAIATSFCVILLPLYLNAVVYSSTYVAFLSGWAQFGYYAITTLLFGGSYLILQKLNKKQVLAFSAISVSASGLILIITAISLSSAYLGWLIVTSAVACIALASKSKGAIESTVHLGAITLSSFICFAFDHLALSGKTLAQITDHTTIKVLIYIHFIAAAFMVLSYWRERSIAVKPRFNVGYYLLSIVVLYLALVNRPISGNLMPAVIFLAEQAAFMIYGMIKERDYLAWSALVGIVLDILILSDSYGWLAMGGIGLLLLMVATWKLTRNHQKEQRKIEAQKAEPIEQIKKPKEAEIKQIEDSRAIPSDGKKDEARKTEVALDESASENKE